MATAEQVKTFIETIAPIIQRVAKERGYKIVSPIIAQACCESAYGTSSLGYKYHNYFGMKCGSAWKGASVNMATKEEFTPGTLTSIRDNFRAYSSMEEGVKGYFDFIGYSRYSNLKKATTPQQYLEYIKADGYATSSSYVKTNMAIVNKYNLTKYDEGAVEVVTDKYFPIYSGNTVSIVNALQTLHIDSNFNYRMKIAQANGITAYKGTAQQNTYMLKLLKEGKLLRP